MMFARPVPISVLAERQMDSVVDAELFHNSLLKKLHRNFVVKREIDRVKHLLGRERFSMLDIGCGTGWTTHIWQEEGAEARQQTQPRREGEGAGRPRRDPEALRLPQRDDEPQGDHDGRVDATEVAVHGNGARPALGVTTTSAPVRPRLEPASPTTSFSVR